MNIEELKKVLKNNKYIEAIDNENNTIQRIYPSEIEKSVDSYFVIKSQSGVISEIGSQSLEKVSHIYLDGIDYKIFINGQQDEQLRGYYKDAHIELKVKQKRSLLTGNVISASLISHSVKPDETLHISTSKLTKDDLSFLTKKYNYE